MILPTLENPVSQLCTEQQCCSQVALDWCAKMGEQFRMHRKQWEYAYIMQVLKVNNMLQPDRRGLGFGVGSEPMTAMMAAVGCKILATDLGDLDVKGSWGPVQLNHRGLCSVAVFEEQTAHLEVDMREIPDNLQDFDFVWSCSSMEHLGGIEKGLDFVLESLKCLVPGGIAVHTTEFNTKSDFGTIESDDLVFFRRRDMERLAEEIRLLTDSSACTATIGCGDDALDLELVPFNWELGDGPADNLIDHDPYRDNVHLKIDILGHVATSMGFIIKKG